MTSDKAWYLYVSSIFFAMLVLIMAGVSSHLIPTPYFQTMLKFDQATSKFKIGLDIVVLILCFFLQLYFPM